MKKTALFGLTIVILATIAAGVATAFAQSTNQSQDNNAVPDPQPGYSYFIVYRQTDGFIVLAWGCSPSPVANCLPTIQPGQSLMDITDQQVLVKQFFTDAHNAKMGNWRVDLSTHKLVNTSPLSTASMSPSVGLSVIGAMLSVSASLGVGTSGTLLWRRTFRRT